MTARTSSTERKKKTRPIGRVIRTPLAVAPRIPSCVGARGIYARRRWRRHAREKMKNGVGGQTATSEARRPSPFVSDTGRTMDGREHTQHTHLSQTSRHQRFSTHSAHSTSLRILCAPSPDGGGQEKNLAGEKRPFQDLASPCSPPSRRRFSAKAFSAKSLPCTDPRGWGSTGSRFPANGRGQSGRMGGRRREGRAADRRCSQWLPSVVMSCVVCCCCCCCGGRAVG